MPRRSGDPVSVFVDTSGWLAFFSARDQHHADADRLFRVAVDRRIPLVTSNLVLAELQRLLLHRAGIRPAVVALDRIDASPSLEVLFADSAVHQGAREWLAKLGDQVITYTDASSFALMACRRCKIALSYDRDFELAGFSRWHLDPDDEGR